SDLRDSGEFEPGSEDHAPETVSTDDPVRVYLREMGSIRLLTRQGEIELAQRMERGELRVRRAVSRAPVVWRMVFALYQDVRQGKIRPADFLDLGASGDAAQKERNALEELTGFARVYTSLRDLHRKIM